MTQVDGPYPYRNELDAARARRDALSRDLDDAKLDIAGFEGKIGGDKGGDKDDKFSRMMISLFYATMIFAMASPLIFGLYEWLCKIVSVK